MSFIELKDVVRVYGSGSAEQIACDHVSFQIGKGEFVVILGPSGAGKSTVLNMLGGMDRPTKGTVMVNGQEVSSMNDRQMSAYRAGTVGFIFQFYNLLPSLTARENVALTRSITSRAKDPGEMLAAVGLAEHGNKFPSELSGGEQQRVSIARALAKDPALILGDEPTGALDSETGILVLELIQKICREQGTTVVLVTHNADIARCADRVIRMKSGRITENVINPSPLDVKEVVW